MIIFEANFCMPLHSSSERNTYYREARSRLYIGTASITSEKKPILLAHELIVLGRRAI